MTVRLGEVRNDRLKQKRMRGESLESSFCSVPRSLATSERSPSRRRRNNAFTTQSVLYVQMYYIYIYILYTLYIPFPFRTFICNHIFFHLRGTSRQDVPRHTRKPTSHLLNP